MKRIPRFYFTLMHYLATLICGFVIILINFLIAGVMQKETRILFMIALGVLILVPLTAIGIYIMVFNHKAKNIMEQSYANQNYVEAIKYFFKKSKSLIGSIRENAQFCLVKIYFLSNEIEKADNCLYITKWRRRLLDVVYFDVLIALYRNDVPKARWLYEKFMQVKSKKQIIAQKELTQIMNYVECPDENNKFFLKSKYVILERLYEMYAKN